MGSKKKTDSYSHKESAFFFFYDSIHFFIHSYPGAVLGFLFVTELAKKLYKILRALRVGWGGIFLSFIC
ncbi:hypothetical protein CN285_24275 [Bacillus cereus]|nr:hypothetical protein CN285_24275 [Bacillus cereus]